MGMPAASTKALLAMADTDVSNLNGVVRHLFFCGINLSLCHGCTRVPKGLRTGSWTPDFLYRCKIAWGPPLQTLLLGAWQRTARSKLQQGYLQVQQELSTNRMNQKKWWAQEQEPGPRSRLLQLLLFLWPWDWRLCFLMQVEVQQLNLKRCFQSRNILVFNNHSSKGRN